MATSTPFSFLSGQRGCSCAMPLWGRLLPAALNGNAFVLSTLISYRNTTHTGYGSHRQRGSLSTHGLPTRGWLVSRFLDSKTIA